MGSYWRQYISIFRFWHFALIFGMIILVFSPVSGRASNCIHPPGAAGEVIVKFKGKAPDLFSLSGKKSQYGSKYQINIPDITDSRKFYFAQPLLAPSLKAGIANRNSQGSLDGTKPDSNLLRLVFSPETDISAVIEKLEKMPNVQYAEPNYVGILYYVPSVPFWPQQASEFGIAGINDAWDSQTGASPSVIVAVIDSGVEADHPNLSLALDLARSYNFADDNAEIFDDIGHGTRVAGIVAASENGEGIAGVGFGCSLMVLDVADPDGAITVANVSQAINWAVARGANIINMSLGFSGESATLKNACDAAWNAGVLLVAAAGNDNQSESPVYPASFDSVIGVGAVMDDGTTRAPWSNFDGLEDSLVEIVAPGETIFSTIPGAQYNGTFGSGTSFAAPIVSGAAALLMSKYPSRSSHTIRWHLDNTATDLGEWAGYGLLDAEAALSAEPKPDLSLAKVIIDDDPSYNPNNDNDGKLDEGEEARLILTLRNEGADADNVVGTLSVADPEISIGDAEGSWGAIVGGGTSSNTAVPFTEISYISLSPTVKDVSFNLSVSANSGEYTADFAFSLETENEVDLSGVKFSYPFSAEQTYHVTGDLILRNATVIPPGTVFKIDPDVDIMISTNCDLTAVGTTENPIVFTSVDPGKDLAQIKGIGPQNVDVNLDGYDQVRYVSSSIGFDSPYPANGGSQNPWASIQYALSQIEDASSSKTYAIFVAEGVYAEGTVHMKSHVDMYGGFSASGWSRDIAEHSTVLDGQGAETVVEDAENCMLDGFVIMNGSPGIRLDNGDVTISNNVFFSAGISASGGKCQASIHNNVVTNFPGSGISITGGLASAEVERNLIFQNVSRGMEFDCAYLLAKGNVVSGNGSSGIKNDGMNSYYLDNVISHNGSGFFCDGNVPFIYNNLIVKNQGCSLAGFSIGYVLNTIAEGECERPYGMKYSNAPSSCYTDSTTNIDADSEFLGTIAWGAISEITFDESSCQSTLVLADSSLRPDSLSRQVLMIGSSHYFAISNTSSEIVVYGDATKGGTVAVPQRWTIFDYHLRPTSPCIGAGVGPEDPEYGANVPAEDIDLDPRSGTTCDIGIDEYEVESAPVNPHWGKLWVQSTAVGATFQHVIVERGRGLFNEIPDTEVSDSIFRYNTDNGFHSTAGIGEISGTTAELNLNQGILAAGSDCTNCNASYNFGGGLDSAALTDCVAAANGGDGMNGTSATDCKSNYNGEYGMQLSGTALRSMASHNEGKGIATSGGDVTDCTATFNGDTGIEISGGGTIGNSNASRNGGDGIVTDGSNIIDCTSEANEGKGVSGSSSSVSDCAIKDNLGAAISGVSTVTNCEITGNSQGIGGASSISGVYVSHNQAYGITGGNITNSTVVGNFGNGIISPTFVDNSWIMANTGAGIVSADGNGTVENSTIAGNGGNSVQDLLAVNASNIHDNGGYGAVSTTTGSGVPDWDFTDNYWGPICTAELDAKNPYENISFVQDLLDGSGNYLINVWPYQSASVSLSPDNLPPAFLLSVSPDQENAVGAGRATFTLTFSKPMNTVVDPSVTFGLLPPYTSNVVEPLAGWLDSTTWQGQYAIQSETGEGTHTIKVSGASDLNGFVIPENTFHRFIVDTAAGLSGIDAIAVARGGNSMSLSWSENGKPANAAGYNILRSSTGAAGTFKRMNSVLVTTPSYIDAILSPSTTYYYRIDIVDTDHSATQWSPAFSGTTGIEPCEAYVDISENCGGNEPCYGSIAEGIGKAVLGDKIKISEGTYREMVVINRAVILELGWDRNFTTTDQADPVVIAKP